MRENEGNEKRKAIGKHSAVSMYIEGKRYLYPLTYSAPLILMWLMYVAGFKNKDTYELNDSHNNHEINN